MNKRKMIVELIRVEENFTYGTFGVLLIDKEVFCVTLEPSSIMNERDVSSIPAQQYECKRFNSPRFGETWKVCNVPKRSYILFHAGNIKEDTSGCIILAEKFGKLYSNRAVLNSGKTFSEFMKKTLRVDRLHLTIKEIY